MLTRLPNIPRPTQKICVIGDAAHNDEAEGKEVPFMSADDLKKLNKDKVNTLILNISYKTRFRNWSRSWPRSTTPSLPPSL